MARVEGTGAANLSLAKRLLIFAKERFEPISHSLMIGVFVAFHLQLAMGSQLQVSPIGMTLLFIGAAAFFFKLRAYDEIKDYDVDVKLKPHRPLARGLVSHQDLYRVIAGCIVIELASFSFFGKAALASMAVSILYSLLMYKEFFIGPYLRPHLTTYAITHTIVGGFLALSIMCAVQGTYIWEADQKSMQIMLAGWCLFNIFEFGRKTYCTDEERPEIESYSKIFGRFGAVALVVVMGIISAVLLGTVGPLRAMILADGGASKFATLAILVGGPLMTAVLGTAYAVTDAKSLGAAYRAASSIVIVFVYGGLFAVLFSARGG